MSSKVISITSNQHFKSTVTSSTYTVVDFYADWCGPCKQISPIFEQLAGAESKPGKIVFCKVNVDNQKDVAQTYGISAMPTFLVLRGTSVIETIRGANPTALRTAILSAAASAAKGPAKSSASFSGAGKTLGSSDGPSTGNRTVQAPSVDFGALLASPASFSQGRGLPHTIVRFLGLYFSTLFSLESAKAAEESPFAVKTRQGQRVG
ncbi:hypothetical protein LTR37_000810 [Vermiconidia calcicola]|uniref:Uncharacterized protein n=1 Tax=Vermiconidia calcicola TaxID=1690605 RepID=A0ACC3NWU6_9PEZI|nr:hypothetical protein LTR37_000810 [Vermiconidia calcicola]